MGLKHLLTIPFGFTYFLELEFNYSLFADLKSIQPNYLTQLHLKKVHSTILSRSTQNGDISNATLTYFTKRYGNKPRNFT